MKRATHSSEHGEQVAVIQWWAHACKGYGLPEFALMAIPNAAKRSYKLASYMKAEGLRAGVPDLFLARHQGEPYDGTSCTNISAYGLFIEMKRKPNEPSDAQLEVMAYLRHYDYAVALCYSADEAISAIKNYLS